MLFHYKSVINRHGDIFFFKNIIFDVTNMTWFKITFMMNLVNVALKFLSFIR